MLFEKKKKVLTLCGPSLHSLKGKLSCQGASWTSSKDTHHPLRLHKGLVMKWCPGRFQSMQLGFLSGAPVNSPRTSIELNVNSSLLTKQSVICFSAQMDIASGFSSYAWRKEERPTSWHIHGPLMPQTVYFHFWKRNVSLKLLITFGSYYPDLWLVCTRKRLNASDVFHLFCLKYWQSGSRAVVNHSSSPWSVHWLISFSCLISR